MGMERKKTEDIDFPFCTYFMKIVLILVHILKSLFFSCSVLKYKQK